MRLNSCPQRHVARMPTRGTMAFIAASALQSVPSHQRGGVERNNYETGPIKLPPVTVQYYDPSTKTQATIAKAIEHKFIREEKWRKKVDDIILEMAEEVLTDLPKAI